MESRQALSSEERICAALAHGSALLFFFGLFAPLLIWSSQRKKSSYVAFQALQSLGYQIISYCLWLLLSILFPFLICAALVIVLLMDQNIAAENPAFILGMQFFMIASILGVGGVYILIGLIGAILSITGRDFRYPILGNWLARYLNYRPAPTESGPATGLDEEREDRWVASLGHASVTIQLWGLFVPMLAWITQRDRSRMLHFQALQALVYQGLGLLTYFSAMALYMVSFSLMFSSLLFTAGPGNSGEPSGIVMLLFFGVMMFMVLVFMVGGPIYLLLGLWAAVRVVRGHDFHYPLLGRLIASRIEKPAESATAN